MASLFDTLPESSSCTWVPEAPPDLSGVRDIELDTETNGLRWWAGDRPIGIAVRYRGRTQYLPWGHLGGGNLQEAQVKRWAERELRGKRITNLNTRFDIHMLREWGVDLEAQGNEVSDVGHYAALLDDHRQHFSLESIAQDYLGVGKDKGLDKTRMASYHAGEVAAYACKDVELVGQLKDMMWPKLTAEGLHKVRQLEDEFIYVVCEMEKNGERIDIELLDKWVQESQSQLHKILLEIMLETGIGNFNPSSPKDMERLFNKLKLPIERTETGRPSFTSSILKTHSQHPLIEKTLRAVRLTGLRSKYLLPYAKTVDRSTGIIRFSLHQLRAIKDDHDDRSVGTISGRCSVTKVSEDEGFPMQGVMKPEKQIAAYGDQFIIRQLHIPDLGMLRLSSDAMQIEYRLFAHETNSPRLLKIFQDDPLASFHKKTHEIFLKSLPNLTYRRMKDTNFAQIYGAGLLKKALMLDYITKKEWLELVDIQRTNGYDDPRIRENPKLREVRELNKVYEREIPESGPLQKRAIKLATDREYICSILGRRSRFPGGARAHKALNTRIQPSGADIMKQKGVELHAAAKAIGFKMRLTVHDEFDGDVPSIKEAKIVAELLNQQSFKLRVPILWETSVGPNWYEQKDIREEVA